MVGLKRFALPLSRITLNLRDQDGRLIASAEAPPIHITDDHKTSVSKASLAAAAATAATVDIMRSPGSVISAVSSMPSKTESRSKRKARDDSVSLDGDTKSISSKVQKYKPYSRKSNGWDARSNASVGLAMSPRNNIAPHQLSMTPLRGGSVNGSPPPSALQAPGSYFGVPINGRQGTISPSLFMHQANSDHQPSPSSISSALPAISQRLSDWATTGQQPQGLQLDPNTGIDHGMVVDDEQWRYSASEGSTNNSMHHPDHSGMMMDGMQSGTLGLNGFNPSQHALMLTQPAENGFAHSSNQSLQLQVSE